MQDACTAWNGNDCRMFTVCSVFTGMTGVKMPATQPTLSNTQAEAHAKTEISAEAENGSQEKQKKTLVAKVTVSEVKVTSKGNTRLTCQVENGEEKQTIIAKNGLGKMLQNSLNKRYEVNYNVMSDGKAWYAIKAKEL